MSKIQVVKTMLFHMQVLKGYLQLPFFMYGYQVTEKYQEQLNRVIWEQHWKAQRLSWTQEGEGNALAEKLNKTNNTSSIKPADRTIQRQISWNSFQQGSFLYKQHHFYEDLFCRIYPFQPTHNSTLLPKSASHAGLGCIYERQGDKATEKTSRKEHFS